MLFCKTISFKTIFFFDRPESGQNILSVFFLERFYLSKCLLWNVNVVLQCKSLCHSLTVWNVMSIMRIILFKSATVAFGFFCKNECVAKLIWHFPYIGAVTKYRDMYLFCNFWWMVNLWQQSNGETTVKEVTANLQIECMGESLCFSVG